MKKQTKLILGIAIVGLGGYLLWKSRQPAKKNFSAPMDNYLANTFGCAKDSNGRVNVEVYHDGCPTCSCRKFCEGTDGDLRYVPPFRSVPCSTS